jgi:ABC-type sugar transport system ATPase subunit
MDMLAGELTQENGLLVYRVGELAFRLPMAVAHHLAAYAGGARVLLGVRAEHVWLGEVGPRTTVQVVHPLGPETHVTVAWSGGTLTARVPGLTRMRPGDPIGVTLEPSGLLFFDATSHQRIAIADPAAAM